MSQTVTRSKSRIKALPKLDISGAPKEQEFAADKRYMTVEEAMRQKSSTLYVLNSAGTMGDVLITVNNNGEDITFAVAYSWLPTDVTEYVNAKIALRSPKFRRAVGLGLIKILTEDEAVKISNDEMADDERRRISMRGNMEDTDEGARAQSEETDVTPQVAEIMNRRMPPRDRVVAIRNLANTLTQKDIHYIMMKHQNSEGTALPAYLETLRKTKRG